MEGKKNYMWKTLSGEDMAKMVIDSAQKIVLKHYPNVDGSEELTPYQVLKLQAVIFGAFNNRPLGDKINEH